MIIASDGSLRVMLSRWENGRAQPDSMYRMLLEDLFNLPAEALGLLPADSDNAGDDLSPLIRHISRRTDPPPAVLAYLATQLAEHARLDNLVGPSYVLPTALGQLDQLEQLSAHGSTEVARLAARFAEFTGWLCQDSGNPEKALQFTTKAVDLADQAGDAELSVYSSMRRSNILSMLGRPQLAASIARTALSTAIQNFPDLVPVCLRQHALASAGLHDELTTRAAVEDALRLSRANVSDETELSPYCTTSYLQMEEAHCLLALGRPADAAEACRVALDEWPTILVRDRTLCLARRAVALVELREVDEACWNATAAVEGARTAPSGRTIQLLRSVAIRLRPLGRSPRVREFTAALGEVA